MPRLPRTNPLKWPGGKYYLADRIVKLMPRHVHYVEPYAGGLSVLLARDPNDSSLWLADTSNQRGVSEVVNDLNKNLTNFWKILQGAWSNDCFLEIVRHIPFSEAEWEGAENYLNSFDPIKRAVAFFVRCRQSLAGRMDTFASISRTRTRGGRNEQVNAWWAAVEGLPLVIERLKNVLILNRPALEVIKSEDDKHTLFYLDPPYLHETRTTTYEYGAFEMSYDDHKALLLQLGRLKGKFMLSGYTADLYNSFADKYSWKRHEFSIPNNAAGGKTKRRMTECLWCNF